MLIKVVGIGDGGCAVLNIIAEAKLNSVTCIGMNTHNQTLIHFKGDEHLLMGAGMGVGSSMDAGRKLAEESAEKFYSLIQDAERLIIVCGMGGGTASGAAPVLARIARESDIAASAVVSRPFTFEGVFRKEVASAGIQLLQKHLDDLTVITNDSLLRFATHPKLPTMQQAFTLAANALAWNVLAGITR